MNIVVAVLILGIVVIIHELGHFLVAKANGITVVEFSVGMGPRLASFMRKGTRYSLKLLPFGGSCLMLGEDETVEDEGAFHKKGIWARFSTLFAGAFFNFILAFVLALIILGDVGVDKPYISAINEGSPAAVAGLQKGDLVTEIDGAQIHMTRESVYHFYFYPRSDKPIHITVLRDGEKKSFTVTPEYVDEQSGYLMGFNYNPYREKVSPLEVIKYSFYELKLNVVNTIKSIGHLILGKISVKEVSGPVGIVNVVGDIVDESESYGLHTTLLSLAQFTILLSANLGVMNLLPIPALDGGRLVFILLEAIRRKPVPKEKEAVVHMVGMALLMLLMVFVMFNDIRNIFT